MISWAWPCWRPWDAPAWTACSLVRYVSALPPPMETIHPSPALTGATVIRCRAGISVSFPKRRYWTGGRQSPFALSLPPPPRSRRPLRDGDREQVGAQPRDAANPSAANMTCALPSEGGGDPTEAAALLRAERAASSYESTATRTLPGCPLPWRCKLFLISPREGAVAPCSSGHG